MIFFAGLAFWGERFKRYRRTTIIFYGIIGGALSVVGAGIVNHSSSIPLLALAAAILAGAGLATTSALVIVLYREHQQQIRHDVRMLAILFVLYGLQLANAVQLDGSPRSVGGIDRQGGLAIFFFLRQSFRPKAAKPDTAPAADVEVDARYMEAAEKETSRLDQ